MLKPVLVLLAGLARPAPCVRATVAGRSIEACRDEVERILSGVEPEPVRTHWVEVGGRRFPPKQALIEVARVQGVPLHRLDFQTMSAAAFFRRLGFPLGRADREERPCVRATIAGHVVEVCRDEVEAVARRIEPEPLREHWVEAAGKRFPPKQLLAEVARAKGVPLSRLEFNTMLARSVLRRLGLRVGAGEEAR